ncbi:RadC family protein [Pseudomonas aeruginosa]|uniref:RadC family protein n=1 Tax=Pseudomonadota TaxID=1224 RepID=UPI00129C73F1|nr:MULTISPECIES: DNA repair protein RadC [Pseudomonadota]MCD0497175.1 DNA repair protein RadC [Achromobacter sp. MY14]MDN4681617.1 DNA repair protein RadC [Pseudomonas aeruginosa]MRI41978.1 DNA repair protein RadC [Stenotrophomonas sp. MH181796]
MSQLSFSSFDDVLLVRDAQGRYLPASVDQILEAARQAVELKMQRGAEFTSPALVKEYLSNKLSGFEHEVFAVLFLDTRHRLIEYREMFHGTIDSASVYPREVVKEALRLNAAAVIVSHNHPSGTPEPSAADRALTQRLKEALGLVDVRVLDHIIVAGNETASFAERGLI